MLETFPKYINLHWLKKRDWNVSYTNSQMLKDENYITTVNLRKVKAKVKIYGCIKDNYTNLTKSGIKKTQIKSVALLKSNIQKAVRLGSVNEALVSSLNLIQIDFISFIRRIIIICIEDVGVPESLPLLTWIIMAYPNFEVTNEIIQYLLLTVYSVCVYKQKHYPDSDNELLDYSKYDYNNPYIISLLIAGEYGGFKGDVSLFNKFVNSTNHTIIPVSTNNLVLQRTISKTDIIRSAIDFHCYPDILIKISENSNLNVFTCKNLIWLNSSSKNYRVKHEIVDKEVWKIITKILNKIQVEIMNKIVLIRY